MVEVDIDIVGDEEVVPAIAVVIAEGGARGPHACRRRGPRYLVTSVKVPSPLLR